MWTGVDRYGQMWTGVDRCGQVWRGVEVIKGRYAKSMITNVGERTMM